MAKKKQVLVTGGAGYIGSVTVALLLDAGHQVTVVDNLSKGKRSLVDPRATFLKLDMLDLKGLTKTLSGKTFDTVLHFAALKDAGESMRDVLAYQTNIEGVMHLLHVVQLCNIKQIIFSSTAAVYGEPTGGVVDEQSPCMPTNFYGYTKLAGEELLAWHQKIHSTPYVALRYFNVAGDGGLRYIDSNAKNIFNVIGDVLAGNRKRLDIFGGDYDTKDGTGVRDYVHVADIARAHVLALGLKHSATMNLGSEQGYSVLEIVHEFEKISNKKIPYKVGKRRPGDIASLVASSGKAKEVLRWSPKHDLKAMVETTWETYKSTQTKARKS